MEDIISRDFDDDITMESSTESLNSQFQRELSDEKLLFYAEEIDDEARILLAEIKGKLGQATMLRRIQPDCLLWTLKLNRFLKVYSLKFSKDDHIAFIKLMYELMTIPNLEPRLISIFGATLTKLLEKIHLISPEELELEWKPLYEVFKIFIDKGQSAQAIYRFSRTHEKTLRTTIRYAKNYFPLTATREILDELRPKLCPLDPNTMSKTVELLALFLPVRLAPKDHHLGYKLWFDEFMKLWEVCHNAPQWEPNMMWLMATLARHNIGYIDWESHIPLMFTRFVRCLNLPVLYKNIRCGKTHKIEMFPIAMWIVAVLGNGSSSQTYMEKFLETIETYLHQANCGPWVSKLKNMLDKLVHFFIHRLHTERYRDRSWQAPTPDTHKLTDGDVDGFVKAMMPVAMTAMFSKMGVVDACKALRNLATMRPNLVIPDVVEKMYSTLDSLTEPHKLTAAMSGMAAVARPMIQGTRNINKGYEYAEGPLHVVPLLFSLLPGIDANDTSKCFVTCRLISIYAVLVPIVDTSRCTVEMNDAERLVSESTSRFEDFVIQFFDRIFSLIESSTLEFLTHENHAAGFGKSKLETWAEGAVSGVCTVVLLQMSDEIFKSALHKLRSFITERILETSVSGQLAATVCRAFSRVNGRETLRALVPGLTDTILEIVGDGEDVMKEENLDKRLLHAMLVLSATVDTPGNNILPHIETLTNVLDEVLQLKSREGSQIAYRLLETIFQSLSHVVAANFLTNGRRYNDSEYPYFREWGYGTGIYDIEIDWYIPREKEIAILQKLFTRYVSPEISKIEEYIAKKISLTRTELLTSLNIISSILEGCENFCPVPPDITNNVNDPATVWTSFLPTVGIKGEIRMPDGSNVRHYMSKLMSNLQEIIFTHSEDDTKSLFELVRIWSTLLLGKIRLLHHFKARCKNYKISKATFEDSLVRKKGHLGGVSVLQRVELHHERRNQTHSHRLTETHRLMILELLKLATSRYANVRSKAQNVLIVALLYFPLSYTVIGSRLLDILATDPDENHEAHKGLLYLLAGHPSESLITVHNWSFLRSLWPAIILSKSSEKLSIIRLKEILVDTVSKHFSTMSITLEVPDNCVEAGSALWNYSPKPDVPKPNADEIRRGIEELQKLGQSKSELYDGLVNDLLRVILEENPHWRHRSMAMSFLRDLAHPDQIYPVKVVRYFVNALVHESLQERKIATQTVSNMLTQQKRKHIKVEVNPSIFRVKDHPRLNISSEWYPGVRLDNVLLQYNYETRPQTEERWNDCRFVNQPYVGYYTWPKKLEIYAPSAQQPNLDPANRKLTDHEIEIDNFFADAENIVKLVKYNSLEERKGRDKFNMIRFQLFKGLFRNHGNVHLKNFLPHLRRLVTANQESSQRCASEITSGLVRATKHWPYKMVEEMWNELTPIIRIALNNLTSETVADWGMCFSLAQECRDPNKQYRLLECLMEEPPLGDSTTSFIESGRLYLLEMTLGHQTWRAAELMERLVKRVEERLIANPLESVRGRLGSLLSTVYATDLDFPGSSNDRLSPRVTDFLDTVLPQLRQLAESQEPKEPTEESSTSPSVTNFLTHVAGVNLDIKNIENSIDSTNNDPTIRLFKTICTWIIASSCRLLYGSRSGFYEIFKIACHLENNETDEELSEIRPAMLAVMAQTLTLPCHMDVALKAISDISQSASWSARAACLNFLEVFVFHNMGIVLSKREWVNIVQDIVLQLLEDERLEVREKAGQVLGGLLHCTFIQEQGILLDKFKLKSKRKLKNRIDLQVRHAGVLGLCAFIQAHPYDVPKYVPSVFENLGLHLNDPQPIPTTIRKTLGDFKRTHYDGWTAHSSRFTEEQLTILQDLTVPPSYYA